MVERKKSKIICKCGENMEQIVKDGQLIALDCKCGLRLNSEAETERMREDQQICLDGKVGDEARQIRMIKRLEFNDAVSPYHRTKWVKPGFRRRLKVKKFIILAGVCFIMTALILLLGGW